jgi:predicted phage terminase large subunit-like protein
VDYWNRTDYLLDVVRMRVDYPALKQLALLQIEKHPPHRVLIDHKASGTQLIQDLETAGMYEVTPYVAPRGKGKITRLYAQTAEFESGQVRLPQQAPWLDLYLLELLGFPGTKVDGQVDLNHTSPRSPYARGSASAMRCRPTGNPVLHRGGRLLPISRLPGTYPTSDTR